MAGKPASSVELLQLLRPVAPVGPIAQMQLAALVYPVRVAALLPRVAKQDRQKQFKIAMLARFPNPWAVGKRRKRQVF